MTAATRNPGGARATQAAAGERSGMFWVAAMTVLLALVPVQFDIGNLLMTPLRLFLLAVVPVIGIKWLTGAYGRLVYSDYAMLFFSVWMSMAVTATHGFSFMITFAGSNILLLLGGYLVGRAAIRSAADFMALAKLLPLTVLLLLPLAIYETLFLKPSLILTWLAEFDSLRSYNGGGVQIRMGLNRAQVVLTHAIHFGIYCSLGMTIFFLSLTNHVSLSLRLIGTALVIFGTFCSLSSGPLLTTVFQLALIAYAVMFQKLNNQWKLLTRVSAVLYVILELNTTKIAFFTLAEKLAFSGHNAYTRQIMVKVGTDLMGKYPLFGYGLRRWPLPYWMQYSNSIDNYWLVLGGNFGIPTLASVLSAIFVPMFTLSKNPLTKGSDLYWIRVSWTILMLGTVLVLATVHLWGNLTTVIYMMLGSGMFLFYAKEPDAEAEAAETPEPQPRGPVYTRFPARHHRPAAGAAGAAASASASAASRSARLRAPPSSQHG
ncbi:MAG: hypothetical protein KDA50_00660 [Rhodobacteraceae bacterium]|nr:hypothetical protein [Paracoccaceae bacterium]